MEDKKTRRKIGIGIAAGLASVSVLLSGIFDSSRDLLSKYPENKENVLEINQARETIRQDGIREKAIRIIYKVPVRIRTALFVPLWAFGSFLLSALETVYALLITPIFKLILSFAVQTLLMFLVIGVCIKILFPDIPWSKIFSKKLFLSVLIGNIFISICDLIIPRFWSDYVFYRSIIRFLLGLAVIFIILRPFIRKKLKNRVSYQIEYDGQIIG